MKDKIHSELWESVYSALEVYSNVHRGTGHKSMASTALFEEARKLVLEFTSFSSGKYEVLFGSTYGIDLLIKRITSKQYRVLRSEDLGLHVGVCILVVKRSVLPKGKPEIQGGGTAKLSSPDWVIWASSPEKFEAGTPAIINILCFVKALQLQQKYGEDAFSLDAIGAEAITKVFDMSSHTLSGEALLEQLNSSMIGSRLKVPGLLGEQEFINFDSSASTSALLETWEAFSSMSTLAKPYHDKLLDKVRHICSDFVGASGKDYEIRFCLNATEAIHILGKTLTCIDGKKDSSIVVRSLMEHSSNDLPWRDVAESVFLDVSEEGDIDLAQLEELLLRYHKNEKEGKQVRVVSLSGASNVLALSTPLKELADLVHRYHALLVVDGAQLVPHRKVDMEELGIDALAFSGHKMYAPFGGGVLVSRKGILMENEALKSFEASGNKNISGVAALGASMMLLKEVGMELVEQREFELNKLLLKRLEELEGMKLFGVRDVESEQMKRKLGVAVFNLGEKSGARIGRSLAASYGIGARAGCHCAHIIVKQILGISPGVEKFQWVIQNLFPNVPFLGVLRISLGIESKEADIDRLMEGLTQIHKEKGNMRGESYKEEKALLENFAQDTVQKVFFA